MSGYPVLVEAVRSAIAAIRLAIDGLELALNRLAPSSSSHVDLESLPASVSHRSWEVLPASAEAPSTPTASAPALRGSPAPSNYSTESYREVAASIPPLPVVLVLNAPAELDPLPSSSACCRSLRLSISHSFPSIAEAKVYCAALGIDLPDQQ